MAGTALGGHLGGITRRLKKLGVDPAIIAQAVHEKKVVPVRLSADNRKRISELLKVKGDKCVLILSSHGKVRVMSPEGLANLVDNGERLHADKPSSASPS